MDSPVIQTVIGLVFIFAVFAGLVSVVTEGIARFTGLRSEFLLRGIRSLVDGESKFELAWLRDWLRIPRRKEKRKADAEARRGVAQGLAEQSAQEAAARAAERSAAATQLAEQKARSAKRAGRADKTQARAEAAEARAAEKRAQARATAAQEAVSQAAAEEPKAAVTWIMTHPLVASSARSASPPANAGNTKLKLKQLKELPSYVSSRSFAAAVLDLVVPNANDETTFDTIEQKLDGIPYPALRDRVLPLVTQAKDDVETLRKSLEQLYDDHMARVSGWYKRHVRWISLGLAVLFAAAFNLNAIDIARTLYSDEAVRAQVVDLAENSETCTDEPDGSACLEAIRKAEDAGIPIGWATAEACTIEGADCTWYEKASFVPVDAEGREVWWAVLMLVLGFALMAAATIPGARFWIDSLSKLGSLRSTGPKPETSTGS